MGFANWHSLNSSKSVSFFKQFFFQIDMRNAIHKLVSPLSVFIYVIAIFN